MSQTPQLAFPAYAGMNRAKDEMMTIFTRVPRVCGDEPIRASAALLSKLRSPRMRG